MFEVLKYEGWSLIKQSLATLNPKYNDPTTPVPLDLFVPLEPDNEDPSLQNYI